MAVQTVSVQCVPSGRVKTAGPPTSRHTLGRSVMLRNLLAYLADITRWRESVDKNK